MLCCLLHDYARIIPYATFMAVRLCCFHQPQKTRSLDLEIWRRKLKYWYIQYARVATRSSCYAYCWHRFLRFSTMCDSDSQSNITKRCHKKVLKYEEKKRYCMTIGMIIISMLYVTLCNRKFALSQISMVAILWIIKRNLATSQRVAA